ncbi:MAG: aminotransferase class V-fold PLP-dependent enzyme [Spirochaetia bacterium]|nr:aminotransferase class V-fold PLP-dependent enzyme [Spirochaetia bacterium]
MKKKNIYLDYNSTHPPNKALITKAQNIYFENFGNTSGLSSFSQKAEYLLETSRESIANNLNFKTDQIIFTASASEANAIAVYTSIKPMLNKKKNINIYISPFEHPSVSETVLRIPNAKVNFLKICPKGIIDLEFLEKLLKNKKIDFLAITQTHNETGILQPINEIIKIIKRFPVPFLVDSVQTLSRLNKKSKNEYFYFDHTIDLPIFFTLSGHKIGAGFGTGILIRPDGKYSDILKDNIIYAGGTQEHEIRPGSHNLASILAFDFVLKAQLNNKTLTENIKKNTREWECLLLKEFENFLPVKIIGQHTERIPGISLVLFLNVPVDFLLMGLDQRNIFVSTGSSCKSKARSASPALLKLGLNENEALSVIRFSFTNLFQDKVFVINELKKIIKKLS